MLKDYGILVLVSLVLLGLVGAATVRSSAPEYARYQKQYDKLTGTQDGEIAIRQINVSVGEGMMVDRCVTCHAGVSNPQAADFPEPLKTHPEIAPGVDMDAHDFGKIGCVACHDGNGRAVATGDAHGTSHAWVAPILAGDAVQANCSRCHDTNTRDIGGAEVLNRGKRLFLQKVCWACHTIEGVSHGKIGPVLTDAGGKFNLAYLRESIVEPTANLASSRMPKFDWVNETDTVEALAIYLKSQRKQRIRAYSRAPIETRRPEIHYARIAEASVGAGRDIFMGEAADTTSLLLGGCINCHTVRENDGAAKGGHIGPELTYAGRAHTREYIAEQIADPKRHTVDSIMPPFAEFDDQEVASLILYLQFLTYVDRDAKEGVQVYTRFCASCHGDDRSGHGVNYRLLDPYPRNLSRRPFVESYRTRFTNSIADGIAGTAMAPWKDILSQAQIETVIDYIVTSSREANARPAGSPYVRLDVTMPRPGAEDRLTGQTLEAADAARGRQLFLQYCTGCHGKLANGKGPAAYLMDNVYPRDLLNTRFMTQADITAERLYRSIVLGVPGTPMPSHSHLSDQSVLDLIAYVRQLTNNE